MFFKLKRKVRKISLLEAGSLKRIFAQYIFDHFV